MYSNNVKFFTLLLLIHIIACTDSNNEEKEKLIAGKWHLYYAEADGNVTDRLDGTTYEFNQGKIKTNIPLIGDGTYSFDNDVLEQKGEQNIKYIIETLSMDSLKLKMTMRDIEFRMIFGRDSLIQSE